MNPRPCAQFDFSKVLRAGDVVTWLQGTGEPAGLTRQLVTQRAELPRVTIFVGISASDTLLPAHADHFDFKALNGAGNNRRLAAAGVLDIVPAHVSKVPGLIRARALKVDVMLVRVRPHPKPGFYSVGVMADFARAMVGAARGYKVKLCLPENASPERKLILRAFGARLILTNPLEGTDGAIREARRMVAESPDTYFYPDQYSNASNWQAHVATTAPEILAQTEGRLSHFVSGIGTGGTITGVGRRLKKDVPGIEIVQIVPEDFPGIEGLKPLQNPGDIIPKILKCGIHCELSRIDKGCSAPGSRF